MLFQILDYKEDCIGYYANNLISPHESIPPAGETWEYSAHLAGGTYDLGRIYAQGASLTQACPDASRGDWEDIKRSLKACFKAFRTSGLSLIDNCFYDVLPEYFLYQYFEMKNKITRHVLENFPRPANYKFMYNLVEMLFDISSRPLNIDVRAVHHLLGTVRGKNFHRTLQNTQHRCQYNPWGTVTGRLATQPNTFPILTMNKEFRACVKPQNDWLVELDFNAAELRALLALAGVEQPTNDIHDWNAKHVFGGALTRDEAKTRTFAWLYSKRSNKDLEQLYNKELVKNKYWDGYKIETGYGRIIENVDEHHALNYIVQSTAIDMVHEQAHKVYELLRGRKSYVSFLVHDAVYIDLAEEDRYDLLDLLSVFKQTRYGNFKVNVAAGKNLGEMRELRL